MGKLATPFRVGLVVLIAAVAFGVGLTLIGDKSFSRSKGYLVFAYFDDATGLGVRSRVQIAGIVVGQVEKIELEEVTARAKVFLRIKKEFVLHRDASITKRSESILGDFLLDLKPGSAAEPPLQDGDEIKNVIRQPGVNEIFTSMNKIALDVGDVTANLRKVLGSEEGENNLRSIVAGLTRITQGIEKTINNSGAKLDQVLSNFRDFSGDLKNLSSNEQEDIREILKNTRDATAEARDVLKTIGNIVGSSQGGDIKDSVKSLRSNLDKLDRTLANAQEITDKVNKGQGTIGHLLNDDRLAKNLDKASTDITNLLGQANNLKVEVTTRSEFLIGRLNAKPNPLQGIQDTTYNPWTKNYFNLRIIPRPDKWYGVELVDDPRGLVRRVTIQNTVKDKDGNTILSPFYPENLTQITTERTLKFSAYLAKRYGPLSARFGIIENTGGVGLKLHLFDDELIFAADAFEFANPLKDHPRVKLYFDYRFLGHLFVSGGVDDLVNTPVYDPVQLSRITSGRDYFVGAGIFFTDDDIKLLLTALPLKF